MATTATQPPKSSTTLKKRDDLVPQHERGSTINIKLTHKNKYPLPIAGYPALPVIKHTRPHEVVLPWKASQPMGKRKGQSEQ